MAQPGGIAGPATAGMGSGSGSASAMSSSAAGCSAVVTITVSLANAPRRRLSCILCMHYICKVPIQMRGRQLPLTLAPAEPSAEGLGLRQAAPIHCSAAHL